MKHWELSAYDNPQLRISVSASEVNAKKAIRNMAYNYGYTLPKKIDIVKGNSISWELDVWQTTVLIKDTKFG